MLEIIPIWIDGYYDTQAEAHDAIREGFEGVRIEVVAWPVLTLDQIEEWLTSIGNRMALTEGTDLHIQAGYHAAINDLLAQVQAWRTGDGHE